MQDVRLVSAELPGLSTSLSSLHMHVSGPMQVPYRITIAPYTIVVYVVHICRIQFCFPLTSQYWVNCLSVKSSNYSTVAFKPSVVPGFKQKCLFPKFAKNSANTYNTVLDKAVLLSQKKCACFWGFKFFPPFWRKLLNIYPGTNFCNFCIKKKKLLSDYIFQLTALNYNP